MVVRRSLQNINNKQQLDQMDYESDDDFELSLQSSIGKEQCFICGTPAGGLLEYYRKFDSIGLSIGPICQSLTPGSENMMMMEMKRLILGI